MIRTARVLLPGESWCVDIVTESATGNTDYVNGDCEKLVEIYIAIPVSFVDDDRDQAKKIDCNEYLVEWDGMKLKK
jgi:hypothetical protein